MVQLPWDEVNARPADRVAEILGLKAARERGKYSCPVHGGTDSLHAYPGEGRGFYCWGACQRAFSNVDLAAAAWNVDAPEACRILAGELGILLHEGLDSNHPRVTKHDFPGRNARSRSSAPRKIARPGATQKAISEELPPEAKILAALRAEGYVPQQREDVYALLLGETTLTDRGANYLSSRGLDPVAAKEYGFRSVDDAAGWQRIGELLTAEFLPEELWLAGLYYQRGEEESARLHLPYGGRVPALLIPYWLRKRPATLRLRRLDHSADFKYLNLRGAPPAIPFNAAALNRLGGADLYVTEGEIDAYTLHALEMRAVGLPGASTSAELLRTLARAVKHVGRLLAWYDADAAGDNGYRRLCDALQEELGGGWLQRHVLRVRATAGKDANELKMKGLLG